MGEVWKDIYFIDKGIIYDYRGLYQVSSLGRVRSLYNKYSHKIEKEFKIIHPYKTRGYMCVNICKDKKRKSFKVHRLVAEAFIPNPENKPQVNHKDCNKQNNCVSNLEWCTQKENLDHAVNNNLLKKEKLGNSYKAKKVNQYDLQGNFIKEWDCFKEITLYTNIQWQNISKCCRGLRKSAGNYIWKYKEE